MISSDISISVFTSSGLLEKRRGRKRRQAGRGPGSFDLLREGDIWYGGDQRITQIDHYVQIEFQNKFVLQI